MLTADCSLLPKNPLPVFTQALPVGEELVGEADGPARVTGEVVAEAVVSEVGGELAGEEEAKIVVNCNEAAIERGVM